MHRARRVEKVGRGVTAWGAAVVAAGLCMRPAPADACGGFFCDGGVPMPVDQSGEDILFITDDDSVEVHIRIQYEGDPMNFAWVIPVLSVPTETRVGSDTLFNNIKAASVPQYGQNTQFDRCDFDNGVSAGRGDSAAGDDGGGTGAATGDPGAPEEPSIVSREVVGAFDVTILEGGTASELIDWLNENGYQQDPDAEPIFEEYLAENHAFAAIKLVGGAGLDELHPIAFSFDHTEPCVPLRLTRIAAVDDMDVRTYFLGDARVVPQTYRHVLVNPLKIDWPNNGANYKEVISMAVDEELADGRAFVTEYAGTSNVVDAFGIYDPTWELAFDTLPPVEILEGLRAQGLLFCGYDFNTGEEACASSHPLLMGILREYLPPPDGITELEFYAAPQDYAALVDETAWRAAEFAEEMETRVLAPGRHAVELLRDNPYLTRMYTTISPNEMLEDPMFHENPSLDEVPNVRVATRRILCSGDNVWTLPDGREVFVPAGGSWPDIPADTFWSEEVQEVPKSGPAMVLARHTDDIDAALAAYNDAQGWAVPPAGSGESGGGASGAGGSEGGAESAGLDGVSSESCSCRTDAGTRGAWGSLFLLGLLAFQRRRRTA